MATVVYDTALFRADLIQYGVFGSWGWREEKNPTIFYIHRWTSDEKKDVRLFLSVTDTMWASVLSSDKSYEKGLTYLYNFKEFQQWLTFLTNVAICVGPELIERNVKCNLMVLPRDNSIKCRTEQRCIPCFDIRRKLKRQKRDAAKKNITNK